MCSYTIFIFENKRGCRQPSTVTSDALHIVIFILLSPWVWFGPSNLLLMNMMVTSIFTHSFSFLLSFSFSIVSSWLAPFNETNFHESHKINGLLSLCKFLFWKFRWISPSSSSTSTCIPFSFFFLCFLNIYISEIHQTVCNKTGVLT